MSLGLGLGIVGGIVGNMLLPGIGGSIGFLAGSLIGNLLDPPKVEGPRLTDLKLQVSEYGRPIPIVYGTMRIAGNVIWQTDLKEHKEKHGGKGGPEVTNYTYSASFAIMLCEGPIDHIEKVYADGRLVWDGEDTDDVKFTLYLGDEAQLADPTMEAELGVGEVPAHRGYCYVVFEDQMLTDFGNRIPQFEFVVATEPVQDIPIERIAENYDDPVSYGAPAIVQWTRSGSQIRIATNNRCQDVSAPTLIPINVQTYKRDLTYDQQTTVLGTDYQPQRFELRNLAPLNPGDSYFCYAVGMYKADSSSDDETPLWIRGTYSSDDYAGPYGIASGSGTVDWPQLLSVDTISYLPTGNSNVNIPRGVEFATLYGLPAGEFLKGGCLSQDQRKLYLFTSPSLGANISKWYEVIDAAVARTGAVTPTLSVAHLFYGNKSGIDGAAPSPAMFENNGRYCWLFTPGSSGPSGGQTGGIVEIAEINPNTLVFAMNTFFSFAAGGGPAGGATVGSIQVLKTGYAGVVRQDGRLAIFRRVTPSGGVLLSDIVADLSSRTPLAIAEYDTTDLTDIVPGYVVASQMEVRNAINPLRQAYFFDAVESGDQVVFVKRGGASVVTVPDADLAARPDGDQMPGLLRTVRTQEAELPRRVYVEYIDAEFDYQHGTQYDERQVTGSQSETTVSLPVSLTKRDAKIIAGVHVWGSYRERDRYTFWLPRPYVIYEPCDVMTVQGIPIRVERVTAMANGVLEFEGVQSGPAIYTGGATVIGGGSTSPPQVAPAMKAPTQLILLDIPVISQHDAPFGFYAAMGPDTLGPWPGAALYKSLDGGLTWFVVASTTTRDTIGDCSGVLANYAGALTAIDATSTVDVVLTDEDATLSSATASAFANGANLCAIKSGTKWELLQFRDATLIAPKTYTLTNWYRGKFGTSAQIPTHAAGDTFVLLPCVNVDAPKSELNLPFQYRAVTFGTVIADSAVQTFTNTGESTDEFFDTEADYLPIRVNLQTGTTYTPVPGDRAYLISFSNASAILCTLPDTGLPAKWWCYIENRGAGALTLDPAGAALLDNSAASLVLISNQGIFLQFDGTNYWTMRGVGGGASPLTTKGDVWGFSTVDARIPIGTNTQVLMADSAQTLGLKWASLPVTTKGDLFTFDTAFQRLAVGSNTQVLTADSTTGTGLKWATPFISPLTTKGDVHTFSTVDARLPVGSNTQVLSAASGETTGLKWVNSNATGGVAYADRVVAAGGETTISLSVPTGVDLIIKIQCRDSASVTGQNQYMYFNADTTAANYDNTQYSRNLSGSGSVGSVAGTTAGMWIGVTPGVLNNANAVASYVININNYSGTTFYKGVLVECSTRYQTTPTRDELFAGGQWKSTAAITSITFTAPSAGWVAGSTFTAYVSP